MTMWFIVDLCIYDWIFCIFRLTKEKESYEKEAQQLEAKVEKMKADGKDEYDIKKQVMKKRFYTLLYTLKFHFLPIYLYKNE